MVFVATSSTCESCIITYMERTHRNKRRDVLIQFCNVGSGAIPRYLIVLTVHAICVWANALRHHQFCDKRTLSWSRYLLLGYNQLHALRLCVIRGSVCLHCLEGRHRIASYTFLDVVLNGRPVDERVLRVDRGVLRGAAVGLARSVLGWSRPERERHDDLELVAEVLVHPRVQERVIDRRAHGGDVRHEEEQHKEAHLLRLLVVL